MGLNRKIATIAGIPLPRLEIFHREEQLAALLQAKDPRLADEGVAVSIGRAEHNGLQKFYAFAGDIFFGIVVLWLASITAWSPILSVPIFSGAIGFALTAICYFVTSNELDEFIKENDVALKSQRELRSKLRAILPQFFLSRTFELILSAVAIAFVLAATDLGPPRLKTGIQQLLALALDWATTVLNSLNTPREHTWLNDIIGGIIRWIVPLVLTFVLQKVSSKNVDSIHRAQTNYVRNLDAR